MTNDELCRIECEMSRERRPLNDVVLKLCHEYRVMRVDRRGLVSLLHDVILQACPTASSLIDSIAIPEYAAAIKFLDEEGMLMVDYARRENEMSNDRAIDAEAACAAMRVALASVPFRAYGEALESGCDAEGAWNSCREECDEHIVRALSSGAGSHLLEWAQQVARYLESQKVINEGRPDYCCAAQEGFVTRARDLGLLERQHDE